MLGPHPEFPAEPLHPYPRPGLQGGWWVRGTADPALGSAPVQKPEGGSKPCGTTGQDGQGMEGGNTLLPAPSLCLSPPPLSLAGNTSENRGPGEDRPELNDHIPSPKSPGRTRRVSQAAPWRLRLSLWLQSWGPGHSRPPSSLGGKTTGTQRHNPTQTRVNTCCSVIQQS